MGVQRIDSRPPGQPYRGQTGQPASLFFKTDCESALQQVYVKRRNG